MLDRRNDNKSAIGYDLGNITSQISYCAILEGAEPETISTIAGEENFNIPTVVCKRHQVNQWYYGNEAVKVSEDGEGILITDLLQKVILHEEIEIEGKFYSAKDLLKLFLRRTFSIMTSTLGIRKIDSLMITVDELSHPILEFLQSIKEEFSVEIKELYIQSREESFFYYVLMQESSLWIKDVLLCDLSEGILKTFQIGRASCRERV